MKHAIFLDGAEGEGGGQILRTALSLSVLTRRPFEMIRIRARRRNPGLRAQHLAAVRAAATLSMAKVEGDTLGSEHLRFAPQTIQSGNWQFDIGTAGSVSLLLQTLIFPLSFATKASEMILLGGTHVPFSPHYHYLEHHWLPLLDAIGFRVSARLERAGFYPRGGGKVLAKVEPLRKLNPWVVVSRGKFLGVGGFSFYANLPEKVAIRQKKAVEACLTEAGLAHSIAIHRVPAVGQNAFLLLLVRFTNCQIAVSALGEPGRPVEQMGREACIRLLDLLKTPATVDAFLADQLMLPLALVPGISRYRAPRLSAHMWSNRQTIQKFLPVSIHFLPEENTPSVTVEIEGSSPLAF